MKLKIAINKRILAILAKQEGFRGLYEPKGGLILERY